MGAQETKEKILKCTTELILERGGDIRGVTIRMIAERAGIGVGLTNHYFSSKEQLVKECIDSVFEELFGILTGKKEAETEPGSDEAIENNAKTVMDFLIGHEAIARAALRRDVENPSENDYTARLVNAFAYAMADPRKIAEIRANDRMTDRMKEQFIEQFVSSQKIKAFMIVSSVKEAFIRRESLKKAFSCDLSDGDARDEFMESLMETVL